MKQNKIDKFIEHCKKAQEMNISYHEYEKRGYVSKGYFNNNAIQLKKEGLNDILSIYKSGKNCKNKQDTDEKATITFIRNEEGKIEKYQYEIYRRDKEPIIGYLNRYEMNLIHRLYSYYGDSLTQRIVSRNFSQLSLVDFKRVLRAFNITKASAPFAPHMIEECSEEELREIQLREKENSFLRKAEEDLIKNNEKLLKKYALENIELKKQLEELNKIEIKLDTNIETVKLNTSNNSNNDLIIHLSDLHIGANVTSGSLYKENFTYNKDEVKKRLMVLLSKIRQLPKIDNIIINLLGDNIDCCGIEGKTARLDHNMPENMDPREQANNYINLIDWFIFNLIKNKLCNKIKIYSVPNGNHGGNYEYVVNKALLAIINKKYPEIETTLFEDFFGCYEFKNHKFIICHGKDAQYMKKGLPLNLDDKSKIMLYEWFDDNKIYGDNIHIIKGDLHSNNINSCKKCDYRNVLSLFGASDYSNYNFSRNSYGVSYELFINNNLIRGTFENI